jgi:hypothetical protein
MIYLPPEANGQAVRSALEPFHLESNDLLVEFLALLGGMGESVPWEEIEFAGGRHRGKMVIVPASVDFEMGVGCLSDREGAELRRTCEPWRAGIQLLHGGDDLNWYIGSSGSLCEYRIGDRKIAGYFDAFSDMIASFVKVARDDSLFRGAYDGLPDKKALT